MIAFGWTSRRTALLVAVSMITLGVASLPRAGCHGDDDGIGGGVPHELFRYL